MLSASSQASPFRRALLLGALLLTPLARGQCAPAPTMAPVSAPVTTPSPSAPTPVVRYGRYTLVEVGPTAAQQDLMTQIIDVTLPPMRGATVGEALRYVLQRSGYQLDSTTEAAVLYSRPLPAADDRLGPMTLREALQVLAGPAWQLRTNEVSRQVWFTRMAESPAATPAGAVREATP